MKKETPIARRGPKQKDPKQLKVPIKIWVQARFAKQAQVDINQVENKYNELARQ